MRRVQRYAGLPKDEASRGDPLDLHLDRASEAVLVRQRAVASGFVLNSEVRPNGTIPSFSTDGSDAGAQGPELDPRKAVQEDPGALPSG